MQQLVYEYLALSRVLPLTGQLEYVLRTVRAAPEILRSRKLVAVDRGMSGNYLIRYRGSELQLPIGDIDRVLVGTGDSPTFSTIREMFANDVYLRAFRLEPAKNVVDLGANRGFFALIARAALGCKTYAGVEPSEVYKDTFRLLCEANRLDNGRSIVRHWCLVGSSDTDTTISVQTIMEKQELDRIHFLKCDIEGGEYDVFLNNNDWLEKCDNIAMELHPDTGGDNAPLAAVVREFGFRAALTDQLAKPCDEESAAYLYASRTGAMIL